jgi:hypothetical protein
MVKPNRILQWSLKCFYNGLHMTVECRCSKLSALPVSQCVCPEEQSQRKWLQWRGGGPQTDCEIGLIIYLMLSTLLARSKNPLYRAIDKVESGTEKNTTLLEQRSWARLLDTNSVSQRVQNSIDDGRKKRSRDRKSLLAYLLAKLLTWLALDEG